MRKLSNIKISNQLKAIALGCLFTSFTISSQAQVAIPQIPAVETRALVIKPSDSVEFIGPRSLGAMDVYEVELTLTASNACQIPLAVLAQKISVALPNNSEEENSRLLGFQLKSVMPIGKVCIQSVETAPFKVIVESNYTVPMGEIPSPLVFLNGKRKVPTVRPSNP